MVFIYTLQLEKGKYYVGKTNNPKFRLEEHFNRNGSEFTIKYKPIKLLELIEGDDFDEDKYTIKYMDKYGIYNVRGGSFSSIYLDDSTIEHINKMLNGANDKCFKCGESGHFAKDCDYTEEKWVWCCGICSDEFDDESDLEEHERNCKKKPIYCYRCGRKGHYASTCYASTHVKGYYLK